jgi:Cd2+/Zn2+-exporting ATPase
VEDCTNHLKPKDCVPHPADRLSRNCCSATSSNKQGCGSRGKDVCSSWQAVCARETNRCCRSYVKCPRTTSSCCSHTMLKLPEIVVE